MEAATWYVPTYKTSRERNVMLTIYAYIRYRDVIPCSTHCIEKIWVDMEINNMIQQLSQIFYRVCKWMMMHAEA